MQLRWKELDSEKSERGLLDPVIAAAGPEFGSVKREVLRCRPSIALAGVVSRNAVGLRSIPSRV